VLRGKPPKKNDDEKEKRGKVSNSPHRSPSLFVFLAWV
jgi:hypothetical protein